MIVDSLDVIKLFDRAEKEKNRSSKRIKTPHGIEPINLERIVLNQNYSNRVSQGSRKNKAKFNIDNKDVKPAEIKPRTIMFGKHQFPGLAMNDLEIKNIVNEEAFNNTRVARRLNVSERDADAIITLTIINDKIIRT